MPQPPPYDRDEYEGWTDTQLVSEVMSKQGAAGAGAQAELTRRFMVETRRSSRRLVVLTWLLVVLTAILVLLTAALAVLTQAIVR
jgi:hypothetical protein